MRRRVTRRAQALSAFSQSLFRPLPAVLRFDQEDLADEHGDRGRLILAQERAAIAQGNPLGSWLESGEPMSTVPRAGGAAAAFLAHR